LTNSPNTPLQHTVKMGHPQSMSLKQASYRRVLAPFVEQIPRNKGWWYRLLSGNTLSNDNQPLPTDAILPHLGHAFGLTELAMWAILIEMGCISQNSQSKTWGINNEGWEFLLAEFGVSKSLQVSPTKLLENGRRVIQTSKQNLARCLKKERAASAKVERDEVREMIVVEVSEEHREPLQNPRKRMKKELIDSNRN
jgi:hypothetical protein